MLYQDGVRFVCRWGIGKDINKMLVRGALYVAPTVSGPYSLVAGGGYETQIQKVIDAGPKFIQINDWNHFPSEYLIEAWEKA
jgi:hypothetical protein